MRIVSGKNRGIVLKCPRGNSVRPTSDKVKEALFQILESRYMAFERPAAVLDLFAGVGTLGLEALSRGAERVVFVDYAQRSLQYLEDNISRCNGDDECRVVKAHIPLSRGNLSRVGKYARFDLVFADPPYSRGLAEKAAVQVVSEGLLANGAIMVIEDFGRTVMPERIEGSGLVVTLDSVRVYGQTGLWFYVAREGEEDV